MVFIRELSIGSATALWIDGYTLKRAWLSANPEQYNTSEIAPRRASATLGGSSYLFASRARSCLSPPVSGGDSDGKFTPVVPLVIGRNVQKRIGHLFKRIRYPYPFKEV
jgi:hypothetical protein